MHVVHTPYILSVCSLQEQQAGLTQVTDYLFEDPWTYNITNALVKKNYARVSKAVFFSVLLQIFDNLLLSTTAKTLGVQLKKNIKSIQLNIEIKCSQDPMEGRRHLFCPHKAGTSFYTLDQVS